MGRLGEGVLCGVNVLLKMAVHVYTNIRNALCNLACSHVHTRTHALRHSDTDTHRQTHADTHRHTQTLTH